MTRDRFRAHRTHCITESVIREMTRLAMQHNAVNLAQGFPDFPAPEIVKDAARQAISADINQYAITWGAKRFRDRSRRNTGGTTASSSIPSARSRCAAAPPKA